MGKKCDVAMMLLFEIVACITLGAILVGLFRVAFIFAVDQYHVSPINGILFAVIVLSIIIMGANRG